MTKRMVINADDFGSCEEVNKAVSQAHEEGVLTSTTIMANMPAAEEAVKIAKKLPNLGVGVHLNLFDGKPLSKDRCVDCLRNSKGQFAYSQLMLEVLSMGSHAIRKAIKTELATQIQWVIDAGIEPTHLDSHKHIHCFPAVYWIVSDLAKQFNINAVRWCYEPEALSKMPWPLSDNRNRKWARMYRAMARINHMQNSKLIKTEVLLGMTHLFGTDVNFYKAVSLYNTAEVSELMTHPAYVEDSYTGGVQPAYRRKAEFNALCSKQTRRYLEDANIKLLNFRQL